MSNKEVKRLSDTILEWGVLSWKEIEAYKDNPTDEGIKEAVRSKGNHASSVDLP